MPRGAAPSQPARTGRQDKVPVARTPLSPKSGPQRQISKFEKGTAKPAKGQISARKSVPKKTQVNRYNPISPERVQEILKRLNDLYPDVTCALTHASAWELLVATILSAQSTDVNVNRVTPELFRKYPTVQAFAALTPEQLEPDVRSPGVSRKTANVVLGSWFKKAEGVVVDTHVHRISRRLELTRENDPQKIEQDLIKILPRDRWILFSHQIIWHGRKLCVARKPRCAECALENICHAGDKTWSTVDMHKNAK